MAWNDKDEKLETASEDEVLEAVNTVKAVTPDSNEYPVIAAMLYLYNVNY